MYVAIYYDAGVGPQAFRQVADALQEELPGNFIIKAVNHRYFVSSDWEKRTAIVVFPGGRDLPYQQKLDGKANKRIEAFVQAGGKYLGVCAGGYYGSASIEFEKGGELEICALRELCFFPGKAIGPAYGLGKFSYNSEAGALAAPIQWKEEVCKIYFNGGCFFEKADSYPNVEVLATYSDLPQQPAAVISCRVGSGQALLTGIHPEYKPNFPAFPQQLEKIHRDLLENDQKRSAFWKYLIHFLIKN